MADEAEVGEAADHRVELLDSGRLVPAPGSDASRVISDLLRGGVGDSLRLLQPGREGAVVPPGSRVGGGHVEFVLQRLVEFNHIDVELREALDPPHCLPVIDVPVDREHAEDGNSQGRDRDHGHQPPADPPARGDEPGLFRRASLLGLGSRMSSPVLGDGPGLDGFPAVAERRLPGAAQFRGLTGRPSRDTACGCSGGVRVRDLGQRVIGLRSDFVGRLVGGQAKRAAQRVGELPAAGVPVGRVLGQRPGKDGIGRSRGPRPPDRQPRRRLGQVGVHHREDLIAREHRRAAQQLERGARQRVLIRPAVHRPALDLLRCRSTPGCPGNARSRSARRDSAPLLSPKSDRYTWSGRPGRTSSSMFAGFTSRCTSPAVCAASSAEATGEMMAAARRRGSGPCPAQQRPHVPAGHVPHRDEQHPAGLPGLVHRDDVRIIHRRGRP